MSGQQWLMDPLQKDYVMEGGAPKQTDSLLMPAYHRMKGRRRAWMYAPDNKWGSDFYTIKRNTSLSDPTLVENTAANSLQPMIDDGRADQISVETVAIARHGVGIKVSILDARGENEETSVIPIGV